MSEEAKDTSKAEGAKAPSAKKYRFRKPKKGARPKGLTLGGVFITEDHLQNEIVRKGLKRRDELNGTDYCSCFEEA